MIVIGVVLTGCVVLAVRTLEATSPVHVQAGTGAANRIAALAEGEAAWGSGSAGSGWAQATIDQRRGRGSLTTRRAIRRQTQAGRSVVARAASAPAPSPAPATHEPASASGSAHTAPAYSAPANTYTSPVESSGSPATSEPSTSSGSSSGGGGSGASAPAGPTGAGGALRPGAPRVRARHPGMRGKSFGLRVGLRQKRSNRRFPLPRSARVCCHQHPTGTEQEMKRLSNTFAPTRSHIWPSSSRSAARATRRSTFPAGSVGTRQLHDGSVTSRKLANGSVTPAKLDARAIGGSVRHWAFVNQDGRVIGGSRGIRVSARRRRAAVLRELGRPVLALVRGACELTWSGGDSLRSPTASAFTSMSRATSTERRSSGCGRPAAGRFVQRAVLHRGDLLSRRTEAGLIA